jgi:uncharacterized repeat protein (TIGR03803 family)
MWLQKSAMTLVLLGGLLGRVGIQAQVFTKVTDFNGTNGGNPLAMSLAQGSDGKLYGTTWKGGANSLGTVFNLKGGTVKVLHSFSGVAPDGDTPDAGLVLATDGKFYGATERGGGGMGTVFSITSGGVFANLHTFNGVDGASPVAPLIQARTGWFYGTTSNGAGAGGGSAFKINTMGAISTVYSFGANGPSDGIFPYAPLIQGSDGNFYGTTEFGGGNPCNCGAVVKVTPAGAEIVLHSFAGIDDGGQPLAGLVQALDGNFYGTTSTGGCASGCGGTIFMITAAGGLTTLHTFTGYPGDGTSPMAGLSLGTDGSLYGTTFQGGSSGAACNCGTVFRITTNGTYRMLYSFTNTTDGRNPRGGLFQATDGRFYGTTIAGGSGVNSKCTYDSTQTCGTIFTLSVGLGPFVIDLPQSAKVGATVKILGSNLSGSTAVTFNGIPAALLSVSKNQIKTTVPPGATSGNVQVTTPGGTLTSNMPFQVLP